MTSRKSRRGIFVAISACLALLACAAVALAVVPNQGKYVGKSSQKRKTVVKVNDKHRITYFRQQWKAVCEKKDSNGHHLTWGPDGTVDVDGSKDKIKQDGTGEFHDSGKYQSNPDSNGYVGHFTINLSGNFTGKTKADGDFSVKIKVTRNGNFVDRCHKSVTWHVPS
jgi:hypothetical protein